MRDPEAIACDALACALAHEPDVRLIGNVTAAVMEPVTPCT